MDHFGEIAGLKFVVVGAFEMDCQVSTGRLPQWGDQLQADSIKLVPGGKALNQAIGIARLGGQVAAVGAVGDDAAGQEVIRALGAEGVDVSGVLVREGTDTPICLVFVGDNGENSVVWRMADESAVHPDSVRAAESLFENADAVVVTFEIPSPAVAAAITLADRHAARVFVNPAPPLNTPDDLAGIPLSHVDALIPNEAEARSLLAGILSESQAAGPVEKVAEKLGAASGALLVCVTRGADGCVVWDEGEAFSYPANPVEVQDAAGGSDAFCSALVSFLTAGRPRDLSVQYATAAGSWAVSRPGARDAMPTGAQLQQHLLGYGNGYR